MRPSLGMKEEMGRRVKVIENVKRTEEEREFLGLGKNLRVMNKRWQKKDLMLDF